MAVVAVAGASGARIPVTVNGGVALSLAQQYAAAVNGYAAGGSLFAANLTPGGTLPTVPGGRIGEAVVLSGGSYSIPSGGYSYLTDGAVTGVSIDEATTPTTSYVLTGIGGSTLQGGAGAGLYVAGGGNNLFKGAGTIGCTISFAASLELANQGAIDLE